MTQEEFVEKQKALLDKLPEEFRGAVSSQAWEDGHAYGYEEVLGHVGDLVYMLLDPIKKYTARIKS